MIRLLVMKAYTDINQSKKLAKILPLESADMRYSPLGDKMHTWVWTDTFIEKNAIPCWSLAALFDVMKELEIIRNSNGTWLIRVWYKTFYYSRRGYKNPVDACVEMIIKLHEQNLL